VKWLRRLLARWWAQELAMYEAAIRNWDINTGHAEKPKPKKRWAA